MIVKITACTAFGLVACLALCSPPGLAQTAEDKTEAKEHFAQGVALFDEGKFSEALAEFEKSYELYSHWKILRNIGMCHYSLGHAVSAATTLGDFLDQGGGDIEPAAMNEVMQIIKGLKAKLGVFKLTGNYSEVELVIDGAEQARGAEGKDIYLEPGVHHVKVAKGEKEILEKNIMIEAGEEMEVFITPYASTEEKKTDKTGDAAPEIEAAKAPVELQPDASPEADRGKGGMKKAGWSMLGVAALALACGSVMGGLTIREKNLMKDARAEYMEKLDTAPDAELDRLKASMDDHYDRGLKYSIASSVLFGVGGAAALAAVILLPLSYRKDGQEKKRNLSVSPGIRSLALTLNF
jgi:tetratricopeptide (TPR) repeat protein